MGEWGLFPFKEQGFFRSRAEVLRVAGRVLLHGRRAVLVIGELAAALWRALWPRLRRLRLAET